MRAHRRAQSARPRGVRHANFTSRAERGRVPPLFDLIPFFLMRLFQNLTLLEFVHEWVQLGCDLMSVCRESADEISGGTRKLQEPL